MKRKFEIMVGRRHTQEMMISGTTDEPQVLGEGRFEITHQMDPVLYEVVFVHKV